MNETELLITRMNRDSVRTGFPKLTRSARQGEVGVGLVSRIVSDTFGWLFKRNHQQYDFGIDGQIEIVAENGTVTGQRIAVQIKCGKSFLQEQNRWGYVYRGELKHFNYLSNYPIPVVITVCDPESKECYWVHFQAQQSQVTESGWKVTLPFANKLSSSKMALQALLPAMRDTLAELQAYWSVNRMIVESSSILYILDDRDVMALNVSTPRGFFDHLRATKELAYGCQGRIEIIFSGYDDDPRELYEIEEVRAYVARLDEALSELFFFVRTQQPTWTLVTFAFCVTNIRWENRHSPGTATGKLLFDRDRLHSFFDRHFLALHEMTDWLGMAIGENEKITFAVCECLRFKPRQPEDAA